MCQRTDAGMGYGGYGQGQGGYYNPYIQSGYGGYGGGYGGYGQQSPFWGGGYGQYSLPLANRGIWNNPYSGQRNLPVANAPGTEGITTPSIYTRGTSPWGNVTANSGINRVPFNTINPTSGR